MTYLSKQKPKQRKRFKRLTTKVILDYLKSSDGHLQQIVALSDFYIANIGQSRDTVKRTILMHYLGNVLERDGYGPMSWICSVIVPAERKEPFLLSAEMPDVILKP